MASVHRLLLAEAAKIQDACFTAQERSILSDRSGGAVDGPRDDQFHHNVGGLPKDLSFELIEPLRDLFKDKSVGSPSAWLADDIVWRHPFPARAWRPLRRRS